MLEQSRTHAVASLLGYGRGGTISRQVFNTERGSNYDNRSKYSPKTNTPLLMAHRIHEHVALSKLAREASNQGKEESNG